MDPTRWLADQHPSILLRLFRVGLWLGQGPYALAIAARNRRFDRGRGVFQVDAPVVSIGNLTTGGTGKTPTVAWLCRYLRDAQLRVATISRGYGAEDSSGRNDEAIELEQQLPDVPHLQNPNRVAAAEVAIQELAAQCLVLDDGFQHRRLARDLDWVIIDARVPWGYGYLLPRGLLREPKRSLVRADAVLISRADQVSASELQELRSQIQRWIKPNTPIIACAHAPEAWINAKGVKHELRQDSTESRWLPLTPVTAFCGIGNPSAFRQTLESLGCKVGHWMTFPDHHRYTREDLNQLQQEHRQRFGSEGAFVCTMKDLVKIDSASLGTFPLWALQVGLEFLDDPAPLHYQLQPIIERGRQRVDEVWVNVDDLPKDVSSFNEITFESPSNGDS